MRKSATTMLKLNALSCMCMQIQASYHMRKK